MAMTLRSRRTEVLKLAASALLLAALTTMASLVLLNDVRRLGQDTRPSRWEALRILFDADVFVAFVLPQFAFVFCVSLLSMLTAALILRESDSRQG